MIKLTSKLTAATAPGGFSLAAPIPGQGWAELVTNPEYNGGDAMPSETYSATDAQLPRMQTIGLTKDGTPSALFIFDPTLQPSLTAMEMLGMIQPGNIGTFSKALPYRKHGKIVLVHWCTDRRLKTRTCFDVLDTVMAAHPGVLFVIFARQPVFTEILPPRGWQPAAQQADPYLLMLTRTFQSGRSRGKAHR